MDIERASSRPERKRDEPVYSLDTFRSAPERNLDADERVFLKNYAATMDEVIARISERPSIAHAILREVLRPDLWKLLFDMNKAQTVLDRFGNSKEGQLALARDEAELANEEYDRKAMAVQTAIREFTAYVDQLNGRSAHPS